LVGWDYWVVADDEFSMLELLIGLPNVRVLRVERINDVLEIHLETADAARFCLSCGMAGVVKERPKVRYADLPVFGQQAVLVWHKYRWECTGENRTWTEERPDIAARSMSAMTHRAAVWATIQVGRLVRPVSQIAAEVGVSWNTIMTAVSDYGRPLIDDPARIATVNHLGVDETVFQLAGIGRRRSFVTAVSDIEARRVLDVFEGRQRVDLARWLDGQGSGWCEQVKVVVTDLHEPFRKAATEGLTNAVLVADPMHVVMAANRCPPEVKGLGRVLKQWRGPILSWHTTGASNGPSEGLNSIIKKLKRVATGFRRFDHYRTRILLAIGGVNWNLLDPARL
jgi:transposase